MIDQLGFDFGDSRPAFQEWPEGTWNTQLYTYAQYVSMFAQAERSLDQISGPGATLYRAGLDAAKAAFSAKRGYDPECAEAYALHAGTYRVDDAEVAAFFAHCEAQSGTSAHGAEYKWRCDKNGYRVAGMYVEGAGSIVARHWPKAGASVSFRLYRDTFFLDSFRDEQRAVYANEAIWRRSYCADKIAMSGEDVASVPTFSLEGREYINDGGTGFATELYYQECEAWSFVQRSEWSGPTYSYREQCKAWDAGRTERGDRRGLVVRVRGQLCVLDGAITVYDDKVIVGNCYAAADDENDDEEQSPGDALVDLSGAAEEDPEEELEGIAA